MRVVFDFDGTICDQNDQPIPGAKEAMLAYMKRGWKVAILSVRSKDDADREGMMAWCRMHKFPHILEFPKHKPVAALYIDDRGYRFEGGFPSCDEVWAMAGEARARS